MPPEQDETRGYHAELQALLKVAERYTDTKKRDYKFTVAKWVLGAVAIALFALGPMVIQRYQDSQTAKKTHVALVRLQGEIGQGTNFSYDALESPIRKAFDDKEAKGVVLIVNSPGGAPAQSEMLYQLIRSLKIEKKKKVVVIGGDVIASGAYMVASAGDKIFAPATSMIGSIGVVAEMMDLSKIPEKYGVGQRVYTSGTHKRRITPWNNPSADDVAYLQGQLDEVHEEFINIVKEGRGKRLANDADLFTGDAWIGRRALKLGLIDGIDTPDHVLTNEFGTTEAIEYGGGVDNFFRLLTRWAN